MKKIVVMAASALVVSLSALPASAVGWYSSSNPLTAYKGSVKAAQGYGDFHNQDGSLARNNSSQRDPYANGNDVYVQNQFYFHEENQNCNGGAGGTCWRFSTTKQTDRTSSSSWQATYRSRTLSAYGDQARDIIIVCEDKPYALDPCSITATVTFSY